MFRFRMAWHGVVCPFSENSRKKNATHSKLPKRNAEYLSKKKNSTFHQEEKKKKERQRFFFLLNYSAFCTLWQKSVAFLDVSIRTLVVIDLYDLDLRVGVSAFSPSPYIYLTIHEPPCEGIKINIKGRSVVRCPCVLFKEEPAGKINTAEMKRIF